MKGVKGLSDQHRLYGLSAILMALTIALCCAWGIWGRKTETTPEPAVSPSAQVWPTASSTLPSTTVNADLISTVAYFQDNYGYLVPVMKTVGNQPGIAKATLEMMVQSPDNDMEAARLGLRTVIPQGTSVDLDISQGVARIDLSREADTFADPIAERNMVSAIVQTLTEFPTVDTVRFLIDGQAKETLKCGTDISGDFAREPVNLESRDDGILPTEAETVTLYFAGESGSVIVPVSRMVYGQSDVETAVLELVKGPDGSSPLENALPSDCGLISVKQENGKVVVNFTKEFLALFENSDGGRQALRALALTCAQFAGVESVEIQVEGVTYDMGSETLAIPSFVNVESTLMEEALQAQAQAIVEME